MATNIPPKYFRIYSIQSTQTKFKLAEVLEDIFTLLQDYKTFTPHPKTVSLHQRFFSYLERCCQSFRDINTHGNWLLNYAQAFHHHLLLMRCEKINRLGDREDPHDCAFFTKVEDLIKSVAEQAVQSGCPNQMVTDYLAEAERLARLVRRDPNSLPFVQLEIYLDDLHYLYTCWTKLTVQSEGSDHATISHLKKLNYLLSNYVLRQ